MKNVKQNMRKTSQPRVSIIILNWNGWRDTLECLESIYRVNYQNYDVIVVDNGSIDDSVQRIKEYANGKVKISSKFFKYNPLNKPIKVFEIEENSTKQNRFKKSFYEKFDVNRRIILIKNNNNYGFAGGNNVGIKFALNVLNPDYVLLLNNDTVVDPNFLLELVRTIENDKKIGVVGPKIHNYFNDTIHSLGVSIDYSKGIASHIRRQEGLLDKTERDCIEGSCMLIRSTVFKEVGLFDENYFAYWEETDLCTRIKKKGYKIIVNKNAKIWHKISWKHEIRLFNLCLLLRNNIFFMREHASLNQNLLFTIYFVFRTIPSFTLKALAKYPLKTIVMILDILFFLITQKQLIGCLKISEK